MATIDIKPTASVPSFVETLDGVEQWAFSNLRSRSKAGQAVSTLGCVPQQTVNVNVQEMAYADIVKDTTTESPKAYLVYAGYIRGRRAVGPPLRLPLENDAMVRNVVSANYRSVAVMHPTKNTLVYVFFPKGDFHVREGSVDNIKEIVAALETPFGNVSLARKVDGETVLMWYQSLEERAVEKVAPTFTQEVDAASQVCLAVRADHPDRHSVFCAVASESTVSFWRIPSMGEMLSAGGLATPTRVRNYVFDFHVTSLGLIQRDYALQLFVHGRPTLHDGALDGAKSLVVPTKKEVAEALKNLEKPATEDAEVRVVTLTTRELPASLFETIVKTDTYVMTTATPSWLDWDSYDEYVEQLNRLHILYLPAALLPVLLDTLRILLFDKRASKTVNKLTVLVLSMFPKEVHDYVMTDVLRIPDQMHPLYKEELALARQMGSSYSPLYNAMWASFAGGSEFTPEVLETKLNQYTEAQKDVAKLTWRKLLGLDESASVEDVFVTANRTLPHEWSASKAGRSVLLWAERPETAVNVDFRIKETGERAEIPPDTDWRRLRYANGFFVVNNYLFSDPYGAYKVPLSVAADRDYRVGELLVREVSGETTPYFTVPETRLEGMIKRKVNNLLYALDLEPWAAHLAAAPEWPLEKLPPPSLLAEFANARCDVEGRLVAIQAIKKGTAFRVAWPYFRDDLITNDVLYRKVRDWMRNTRGISVDNRAKVLALFNEDTRRPMRR